MTGTAKTRTIRFWQSVGVAAFWLALWTGVSCLIRQEVLLPTPLSVLRTLGHLAVTGAFWQSVGLSLARVLVGFSAALAVGSALAILTVRVPAADRLLRPLLHGVRAAPVVSFIILAYFWIGVEILPACIAFLMVLPLVWTNVSTGIRQTDRRLLEMAQVFHLGRRKTLQSVWLPSVRPYLAAACGTGVGFAWKSGIAAEVICSPATAIGTEMKNAKAYLEMPEVFAWTVTVVALSILLERGLLWLLRRRKGGDTV